MQIFYHVGDHITTNEDLLYPTKMIKKGSLGVIHTHIHGVFYGIRWHGIYYGKDESDVVNCNRENIVSWMNYLDKYLFEINDL